MTHKLRRLARFVTGLSSRQAAGLLVMVVICAGIAVAAVTGQAAVATCLLALLLAGTLAGVLLLTRRIGGMHRTTQDALRDLRVVVEQLQRRVIASVEKERLAAGDRHLELTEALARTERLTGRGAELLLREQTREVEALLQLFQQVTPRAPMPAGATLCPTDLLGLVHIARSRKPELAVALGSGPSTIWLGYALEQTGSRLVAVDHDGPRADGTRAMLLAHGLTAVEVRHAPLAELSVDGRTVDWYDVDALDGLRDIDLLFVDGSIAPSTPDALTPALHVLGRRLATDAAVVADEMPAAESRVAPRQGGFPLTAQRRLAGRWTTLAYPKAPLPVTSP
ncbi:class I SAM-dependent methyltransferase [Micromonosporaceae bacterium Da 78-11]